MRALRRRLAKACPDAAVRAAAHSISRSTGESPARQRGVVAGYLTQGSELDPGPLLRTLVATGWIPSLPRSTDRDGPLAFHATEGSFTPDAFGIPAPSASATTLVPDLVIVPVLAFDRTGGRLGQGAGCYDRTIAALRASATVRVIGLAYCGQEIDRVPTDEHDQRLDGILTDTGFIEVVDTPA